MLRHISPFEDSDFTIKKFEAAYTADLANGLGNLVSRVAGLIEQNQAQIKLVSPDQAQKKKNKKFDELMDGFLFDQALKYIWDKITEVDGLISETKPWLLAKEKKTKKLEVVLNKAALEIYQISQLLKPFLPKTAEKIEKTITAKKITKGEPLFPRLN